MPFAANGVYTPVSGATTATPGALIRSAVWNSSFGDISSALTLLGQQLYGTTSVTTTPYVPLTADTLILMNVSGAAVVNLPTAASRNGYPLALKDVSGAANTNNITINPNGADRIEGLVAITINAAWGGYILYPVSGGWILR